MLKINSTAALISLFSVFAIFTPISSSFAQAQIDSPQIKAAITVQGAITVNVNMARVLRVNSPAATVIIGNPGIADVTIQDAQTLILTGKSYGQTNLIVLDGAGNPIADTLIEVVQTKASVITIYMGQARNTLACEPVCQPTATLGDDINFTSGIVASSNIIEEAAQ